MNYILFIIQDANFQSRSMLVPEKEFLETRRADLELLTKHSRTIILSNESNEYLIDNLLVQNIIWEGNTGRPEEHEFTKMWYELQRYADGVDGYLDERDSGWHDKAITNFCRGFNHVKNYSQAKNLKAICGEPLNIVKSFLLLQSKNGRINQPAFDTVDDMMQELYSN